MKISKLRVQNFRSHSDFLLNIGEKSTLISGENGSGKTSLLEAIYFALQGTSFRSSDKEILKNDGSSWFRIDLKTDEDSLRTIKFEQLPDNKTRKTFEIDGKKELLDTSTCQCSVGGKISVVKSAQNFVEE